MSYAYRKVRVEPCRSLFARWRATPICTDDGHGEMFAGLDLELDGLYVLCHPFKFSARTRERAIARATRWMERVNAQESRVAELTTVEDTRPRRRGAK